MAPIYLSSRRCSSFNSHNTGSRSDPNITKRVCNRTQIPLFPLGFSYIMFSQHASMNESRFSWSTNTRLKECHCAAAGRQSRRVNKASIFRPPVFSQTCFPHHLSSCHPIAPSSHQFNAQVAYMPRSCQITENHILWLSRLSSALRGTWLYF